jgi:hypothetical protein
MESATFMVKDNKGGPDLEVTVEMAGSGALLIRPKGYGDANSVNGFGTPIVLENVGGTPILTVFDDIANESGVAIDLARASEECREVGDGHFAQGGY